MRFYGLFLLTSLGFYERGRVKSPYASESKPTGMEAGRDRCVREETEIFHGRREALSGDSKIILREAPIRQKLRSLKCFIRIQYAG